MLLVMWTALLLAFPLLRNWFAWKMGSRRKVRIGLDPWAGREDSFLLPESVLRALREQDIHTSEDTAVTSKRYSHFGRHYSY
jgi:hypothetical protein